MFDFLDLFFLFLWRRYLCFFVFFLPPLMLLLLTKSFNNFFKLLSPFNWDIAFSIAAMISVFNSLITVCCSTGLFDADAGDAGDACFAAVDVFGDAGGVDVDVFDDDAAAAAAATCSTALSAPVDVFGAAAADAAIGAAAAAATAAWSAPVDVFGAAAADAAIGAAAAAATAAWSAPVDVFGDGDGDAGGVFDDDAAATAACSAIIYLIYNNTILLNLN